VVSKPVGVEKNGSAKRSTVIRVIQNNYYNNSDTGHAGPVDTKKLRAALPAALHAHNILVIISACRL